MKAVVVQQEIMPNINKELLKHLADLARVDISGDEEDLMEDFEEIVEYVEKLEDLDLENVEPMSGGSFLGNVWREDEKNEERRIMTEETFDFPEEEEGYNKIPPVF